MDKAEELIEKYRRGECTEKELELLRFCFHHYKLNDSSPLENIDYLNSRQKFHQKIAKRDFKKTAKVWLSAASITLVIGVGIYLTKFSGVTQQPEIAQLQLGAVDRAMLVVNRTRKVNLNDVSTDNKDVHMVKDAAGDVVYEFENKDVGLFERNEIKTILTPKKQILKAKLPDGTLVWLNAQSEISFKANFEGDKYREVTLKGEAYFEVAKNPVKPFRVVTQTQTVRVLGTHFNINTKQNGRTETSLMEGSVVVAIKVAKDLETNHALLKPGQQTVLAKNTLAIRPFDEELVLDWKSSDFIFKNESLKDISLKLSDWYNIRIELIDSDLLTKTFTGRISRKSTLTDCLEILESGCDLSVVKKGDDVYALVKQSPNL